MSAHCQVTGSEPGFGTRVSHSHRRTRRRRDPNLPHQRFDEPGLGRIGCLRVGAKALRIIDRRDIDAVVPQILAQGEKV